MFVSEFFVLRLFTSLVFHLLFGMPPKIWRRKLKTASKKKRVHSWETRPNFHGRDPDDGQPLPREGFWDSDFIATDPASAEGEAAGNLLIQFLLDMHLSGNLSATLLCQSCGPEERTLSVLLQPHLGYL